MEPSRKTLAHVIFAASTLLVVCGIGLLLLTTDRTRDPVGLWPLGTFMAGVLLGYAALQPGGRTRFLLLGAFMACASAVMLAATLTGTALSDFWPLFAVSAGVAIVPAGIRHYRKAHAAYIVPAASFLLLGSFFSVFSFGFSSLRFADFMRRWWPGLFIAAGLILLILWILNRARFTGRPGTRKR